MPERLRLLLVEDSEGDARLLSSMLGTVAPEVTVEHVRSLDEGVQRLTQGRFDAVLLDLGLPDSQGLDSVATTHLFDHETPIVVLTGLDDDEAAFEALRAGAQDYLVKGKIDGHMVVRTVRFAQQRLAVQARLGKHREGAATGDPAAIRALAVPSGASLTASIAARVKACQEAGHPILYVSFDRPAGVLLPRLHEEDVDGLHCIDASGQGNADDGAVYTPDDPRDLESLAVEVENACAALGPDAHVVVDSLNSLIMHHGVDAAAVFGHTLANRLRLLGIAADFVGHRNQEWPFILDRFSFLDGEVAVDEERGEDPSVA